MGKSLAPVLRRPYYRNFLHKYDPRRIWRIASDPVILNICIDGKLYLSTTRTPSNFELRNNPAAILFTENPTVFMWSIALDECPRLIRYAPVDKREFLSSIMGYVDLKNEHLENIHPNISNIALESIIMTVPIDLEKLEIFMNKFNYVPKLRTLEKAIIASKSTDHLKSSILKKIAISCKVMRIKAQIIQLYFRLLGADSEDFRTMMMVVLRDFSKKVKPYSHPEDYVKDVVECICEYYMKYQNREWLNNLSLGLEILVKDSLLFKHLVDLEKY